MTDEQEKLPWKCVDIRDSKGETLVSLMVPGESDNEAVLSACLQTSAAIGTIMHPDIEPTDLDEKQLNKLMMAGSRALMLAISLLKEDC